MNGGVKFEDALAARLDIIKPSKSDIKACLAQHPPQLVPGIKTLIETLHANGIEVFLVSGGFRLMIEPVAKQVNVPVKNIYANTIFFGENGEYAGFDDAELTSRDGGKATAINVYDTDVPVALGSSVLTSVVSLGTASRRFMATQR